MLVTVTLLTFALVPTGDEYWRRSPGGIPVKCFFKQLASKGPSRDPNDGFVASNVWTTHAYGYLDHDFVL